MQIGHFFDFTSSINSLYSLIEIWFFFFLSIKNRLCSETTWSRYHTDYHMKIWSLFSLSQNCVPSYLIQTESSRMRFFWKVAAGLSLCSGSLSGISEYSSVPWIYHYHNERFSIRQENIGTFLHENIFNNRERGINSGFLKSSKGMGRKRK